jgi:HEAT repeat protein
MLSHDDPFTRIAAIKALRATGAPQARAAIERRLDVETAESVRRAASATLSRQVR